MNNAFKVNATASIEGLMVWLLITNTDGKVAMKGRIANNAGVTEWAELDEQTAAYIAKLADGNAQAAARAWLEVVK